MAVAQDNLTWTFIVIAIILAIVSLMLAVNNRRTEKKLRSMAHHLSLLQRSEAARALCERIRAIDIKLCAGLDYTMKENGDDVEIDEWYNHHPRP